MLHLLRASRKLLRQDTGSQHNYKHLIRWLSSTDHRSLFHLLKQPSVLPFSMQTFEQIDRMMLYGAIWASLSCGKTCPFGHRRHSSMHASIVALRICRHVGWVSCVGSLILFFCWRWGRYEWTVIFCSMKSWSGTVLFCSLKNAQWIEGCILCDSRHRIVSKTGFILANKLRLCLPLRVVSRPWEGS